MAVSAPGNSAVVGEFPAHECTTHESGASCVSVAHLRHVAAAQGTGALVLSLALVSTGHNEHGRTVHDTETNSTDSDTCGRGPLRRGLLTTVTVVKRIVGTGLARSVTVVGRILFLNVAKDIDLRVDLCRQVTDECIVVVVDE